MGINSDTPRKESGVSGGSRKQSRGDGQKEGVLYQ